MMRALNRSLFALAIIAVAPSLASAYMWSGVTPFGSGVAQPIVYGAVIDWTSMESPITQMDASVVHGLFGYSSTHTAGPTFTSGPGTATLSGTIQFTPALPSETSVTIHFRAHKASGGTVTRSSTFTVN